MAVWCDGVNESTVDEVKFNWTMVAACMYGLSLSFSLLPYTVK